MQLVCAKTIHSVEIRKLESFLATASHCRPTSMISFPVACFESSDTCGTSTPLNVLIYSIGKQVIIMREVSEMPVDSILALGCYNDLLLTGYLR